MSPNHCRFQIIGDHHRWTTTQKLEGVDMRTDPVLNALARRGLAVGVVTCPEDGDKDLR